MYLVQALKLSLWFDGYPDNGPFQIFNPLRRIAAGQVGGRDFIFFHGIGVPYLHYPLFALFGGETLIASELSRQLTSFALFVLSLAAFVRITMTRAPHRWIGAAVAVMFIETLFPGGAAPGHSLLSARSTMPIFAFAALQVPIRERLKAILVGLCVALGFVCGTEHGVALALALVLVSAVTVVQSLFGPARNHQPASRNIGFAILALATAAIVSALLLFLLCGVDGSGKALHYNLVELPANQFWFFGGPSLPYLGAWRELILNRHVVLCFLPTYFALAAFAWILLKSWNCSLLLGRDWQALALLMLVYGVFTGIPLLAILSKHYVFPLARILALTGLLVFANAGMPRMPRIWARRPGWPIAVGLSFLGVCMVAAVALAFQSAVLTAGLVHHLRSASPAYSRFLDRHWDTFMADATRLIDSKRRRSTVSLWSVNTALLESHYGVFPPAEDYIIHAVGTRRWRHYLATFQQTEPEFVQTMTQDYAFQEGQQDEMWEFFEALLDNYAPLKIVGHGLFWQRTDEPWRQPAKEFRSLEMDRDSSSAALPVVSDPGPDRIGVVRVHYRISNRSAFLPLLGRTPRYLVAIEGSPRHLTISVSPDESEFQFPVQLQFGKPVRLRFRTDSLLPGVTFQPYQVQFKVLQWQPSQRAIYAPGSQEAPH
ncbi:MAG: hypothetical protein ABSC05_08165 [Candidatus Solibacter sp.]